MNFRTWFWNLVKDPIASALLPALLSHAKLMFQAY